jgi:hypothetical protein
VTAPRRALWIAAVLCAVYAAGFISIAVEHVRYPGFTEAMEGDVLQHVERAAAGKPIYVDPTDEFIPLAYFPGYYYLAAPFHWWFGDDLAGPRLASSLAAVVAGVVFGLIVFRESKNAAAGLVTTALFFAGYRIKDENLTTALPDAALLLWMALGWAMLLAKRNRWTDLAAAAFFSLAMFTKQQGLLLGGCGLLYLALTNEKREWSWTAWRRAVVAVLLWGAAAFIVLILGNRLFGGRMTHFTVEVPSHWGRSFLHSFERFVLVSFLFVPFCWIGAACYALRGGVRLRSFADPFAFLITTASGVCLFTVATSGSSNNHYIPLFSLLEATMVLGCLRIWREGPPRWLLPLVITSAICGTIVEVGAVAVNEGQHPLPLFAAPLLIVAAVAGWVVERRLMKPNWWAGVILVGQFAVSFYQPWSYWPPADWQIVLEDFRKETSRFEGDIAWPDYGAIPTAFTERPFQRFPSWVVLEDVTRTDVPSKRDFEPFRSRMQNRPPKWLIASDRLEFIPVWTEYKDRYFLEIDYESRFQSLRQLNRHWFGSLTHPRYLYRFKAGPQIR